MQIEFRLGIQQNVSLAGRGQHLRGIHARSDERHRAGQIAADAVCRLAHKAEFRQTQRGDLFRQHGYLCGLRMLLCEITQQHRCALAARQAAGDGARLFG